MQRGGSSRSARVRQHQDHEGSQTKKSASDQVSVETLSGLIAYPVQDGSTMSLVPAPVERDWLDATADRFGYRCLPVLIANQAGWFVLNSHALDVIWDGGASRESLTVTYRSGDPPYPAVSHFGHGILTWHIPFLFETPPGVQLLARGPANSPKDAIYALEGVIETEWAAATFTMNWQVTRPRRRIIFEPGEPICMVMPLSLDLLEQTQPEIRRLSSDAERQTKFQTWSERRAAFLSDLGSPGSEAAAQGWQKDYFRGRSPDGDTVPGHRTRLRLLPFEDVDGTSPPEPAGTTQANGEFDSHS
jgi:hypothetical protein